MNKSITGLDSVGSVVAKDYEMAAIFYRYKIDFCCKGDKSIGEVCNAKNIDQMELLEEINSAFNKEISVNEIDFYSLDELIEYIVNIHHAYIRRQIPVIDSFLHKLCEVHGSNHPELLLIKELFEEGAENLLQHMMKEESVLFPMINNMVLEQREGRNPALLKYSTYPPIRMMQNEHEAEGERFGKIAELTSGYVPPADGCSTYKSTYALLKSFEKDLHRHIHLENNVLFPSAIEMENGSKAETRQ